MRFTWGGTVYTDDQRTSKDLEERHRLRKPPPSRKHKEKRGKRAQQKRTRVKVFDSDLKTFDKDLSLDNRYASVIYRVAKRTEDTLEITRRKLEKALSEAQCDRLKKDIEAVLGLSLSVTKTASFRMASDNHPEWVDIFLSALDNEDNKIVKDIFVDFGEVAVPDAISTNLVDYLGTNSKGLIRKFANGIKCPEGQVELCKQLLTSFWRDYGSEPEVDVSTAPGSEPSGASGSQSSPDPGPPSTESPSHGAPPAEDAKPAVADPKPVEAPKNPIMIDRNEVNIEAFLSKAVGKRLSACDRNELFYLSSVVVMVKNWIQNQDEFKKLREGMSPLVIRIPLERVSDFWVKIPFSSKILFEKNNTALESAVFEANQTLVKKKPPNLNVESPNGVKAPGVEDIREMGLKYSTVNGILKKFKSTVLEYVTNRFMDLESKIPKTDVDLLIVLPKNNRSWLLILRTLSGVAVEVGGNEPKINGNQIVPYPYLLGLIDFCLEVVDRNKNDFQPGDDDESKFYSTHGIYADGKRPKTQKKRKEDPDIIQKNNITTILSAAQTTKNDLSLLDYSITAKDIANNVIGAWNQNNRKSLPDLGARLGVVLSLVDYLSKARDIPKGIKTLVVNATSKELKSKLLKHVFPQPMQRRSYGRDSIDPKDLEKYVIVYALLEQIRDNYSIKGVEDITASAEAWYEDLTDLNVRYSVLQNISDVMDRLVKIYEKPEKQDVEKISDKEDALERLLKIQEKWGKESLIEKAEYTWDDVKEDLFDYYRDYFKDDQQNIPAFLKTESEKRFSVSSSYEPRLTRMNHLATYHGVLIQTAPAEAGPKWTSIDKRYLNDSHYKSILACAKEFLKGDWITHSWDGGGPDSTFRAALDLAIATADGCMYQSKIDAPTYNILLDKLQNLGNDMMVDTLLPTKVAATTHKAYMNAGKEPASITGKESAMENQEIGSLIRVAFNNPESRPALLPIIAAKMEKLKASKKSSAKKTSAKKKTQKDGSGSSEEKPAASKKSSSKKHRKASVDVTFDDARW